MLSRIERRPFVFFALVSLVIVLDGLILGPYSYIEWHDLGDSHFPRYHILSTDIFKHGFFYWYPYSASGIDLLSNGMRITDIFEITFIILPDWLTIPFLRFCQYLIAGYFCYLVCLKNLSISKRASFLAGLCFLLLQLNKVEFYFGLGAIPLLVWALEWIRERHKGWRLVLFPALIGVAYSFVAPAHLSIIFAVPVIIAWFFVVRGYWDWRTFGLLTVFGAFSVIQQMDMVLAMVLNSPLSFRALVDINAPPYTTIESNVLTFLRRYWGLIVVAMTGSAIAWRQDKTLFRLLAVVGAILFIVYFENGIRAFVSQNVRFLNGFNIYRLGETLPFVVSIAVALGFERVSGRLTSWLGQGVSILGRWRISWPSALFGVTLVFASPYTVRTIISNVMDWGKWGSYTANFRSPVIANIAEEFQRSSMPFRVATIQENGLQPAYPNAYGLEIFGGQLNMYQSSYKKFSDMVTEPFFDRASEDVQAGHYNTGWHIGLLTDDGHPVEINTKDYFRLNLLSLSNVKYIFTTVPLKSEDLELLPETKPERYWDELSTQEKIRKRLYENFAGRQMMVYRNKTVLPRWFLAGDIVFHEGVEEFKSLATNAAASLFARTVFVDAKYKNTLSGQFSQFADGNIETKLYSPDKIILDVSSKGQSMLVVTNSFSPYWKVKVNGVEGHIIPVDLTFWGVVVPAGEYTVEFSYKPPYAIF